MPSAARTVVIIDDDPDHALIVGLVLEQIGAGAQVRIDSSRAGFLDALATVAPGALMLLDRCLGPTESFDLLTQARMLRPDITTVMLSAVLSTADRARALRAGAVDAREKPGSIAGWRVLLTALLKDGQAARAA
ncbi:MAG: response regulator [Dehalococcoidia bacterium]|nr:response regulator [Dehalococcoidia bacterium]